MSKNTNPKPTPEHTAGKPLGSLRDLDNHMAASGYDEGHPWRDEVAAMLEGVDNINCAVEVLDDLLRLALQKCVDAGVGSEAQSAIRAARRYTWDITNYTSQMTEVAA